ncbi:hypothetical protein HN51_024872 [Arachis hypogaea]
MSQWKAQPRGTKQWVGVPDLVFLQAKASSLNPKSKRKISSPLVGLGSFWMSLKLRIVLGQYPVERTSDTCHFGRLETKLSALRLASLTQDKGGGQLLRQLRVLAASFWRLASKVGGLVSKLPSASVKSLSIINWKNGGEGGPHFNGKGGIAVSQPLLYNKLPFAQQGESGRVVKSDRLRRSLLAYVVVGLPTRTRPPECLLGSGRSQADTYDRRRKDPHFIAPGNASLIEDWGGEVEWKKRLGMDFGVFVRAVCGESRMYAKILTGYEITGARSSGIYMGILSIAVGSLFKITAVPFRAAVERTAAHRW